VGKKSKRRNRISRNWIGIMENVADEGRCSPVGTPILDQLAELDEILSAKEGADWVYSVPPDPDGTFLIAEENDFILGPKARAAILDMRKIDNLIAAVDRDDAKAGAGAV